MRRGVATRAGRADPELTLQHALPTVYPTTVYSKLRINHQKGPFDRKCVDAQRKIFRYRPSTLGPLIALSYWVVHNMG